ncbi:class I SAM-dependent methyltransferase [Vibrio astriarenae]|uniref:class I SAM-dependent methyltransferase n=1 Tax=Vibrio astriarenae TaxID=1481923 RepID=UPI00373689F0
METSLRKLDSKQTSSFDVEYIDRRMFKTLQDQLDAFFDTSQPFHLLDVGGGNGMYADKVLAHYPTSVVTLVEPENTLLEKNRPNLRKKLLSSSFQDMKLVKIYDIIQFNWVLHHFVADTYEATKQLQFEALEKCYECLAPGGIVVIFENFYEGVLARNLPSSLIYHSTASKFLAPITHRMGANTAGVGVCFHSRSTWHDMILDAGFASVLHAPFYPFGNLGSLKSNLLHIKQQNVGLLIGRKAR